MTSMEALLRRSSFHAKCKKTGLASDPSNPSAHQSDGLTSGPMVELRFNSTYIQCIFSLKHK
jgi:hypothetical protein